MVAANQFTVKLLSLMIAESSEIIKQQRLRLREADFSVRKFK